MSQVGGGHVDKRVYAVREVEVPILVWIRSSCSHVTEEGRNVSEIRT